MHHPLGQIVERVVGGDPDDAHAHHQRHQVQLAKNQQRDDGACQRANADRNQTQQQRAQGTEHRHNQQNHPKQGGDTEGRNIPLCLLAGVIAVEHGPARQQLRLRILRLEFTFQRIQRGDQLVRLLHIKRRTGQLAMQQVPVVALFILGHQPAVHQPQALAVFGHCQLRAAHQHQRVVLQLFAADTGKSRVELGKYPLRLRFTAVL